MSRTIRELAEIIDDEETGSLIEQAATDRAAYEAERKTKPLDVPGGAGGRTGEA